MDFADLPKRRLGRTGMRVSPIGLGGAHLGRTADGFDERQAIATVHLGLELGVNLIDTSPMYGPSEDFIGTALREWQRAGGPREELVISTKTGFVESGVMDYTGDWTRRSVERSLKRLGCEWIDVLLVHDPRGAEEVFAPGAVLETLEALKQQGVIRAIGLGVRNQPLHRQCIESGRFDVSLTHCDYNLLDHSADEGVLPAAAEHDVGVLNGAAVMLGLLGGEDPRRVQMPWPGFATEERVRRAGGLWDWAQARGVSLLAVNLQFCLREERIASTLVGACDPAQLAADLSAAVTPLPEQVWSEIADASGGEGRLPGEYAAHRGRQ